MAKSSKTSHINYQILEKSLCKLYISKLEENEIWIDLVDTRSSGLDQPNKKLTIFTPLPIQDRIDMSWDILNEHGHILDGEPDIYLLEK